MTSIQTDTQNVFAGSLLMTSDEGLFLTKNEFDETVASLKQQYGRVTGKLVRQIRSDWEALSEGDLHPATAEADAAYRRFVKTFGALELFELLSS
jgi:hypothetical protein